MCAMQLKGSVAEGPWMARVPQALQFRTTRHSSGHAKAMPDPDAALIEAVAAALLESDERSECLREIIRHLAPSDHDKPHLQWRCGTDDGSGSRH